MSFAYYFHRIIRNAAIPLVVGLIAAFAAMLVTWSRPVLYSSDMILGPGLAGEGYRDTVTPGVHRMVPDQSFYENLRILALSPDIHQETVLRILAQQLALQRPDPKICSPENWRRMIMNMPNEILQLVMSAGERDRLSGQPSDRTDTTLTQEKVSVLLIDSVPLSYVVKAGDFPTAIAEQFGITMDRLEQLNPGQLYPVYGGQRLIIGYARDTTGAGINVGATEDSIPTPETVRIIPNDPVLLITDNLTKHLRDQPNGYLEKIISSNHPIYSTAQISKIRIQRISGSELVRVRYLSQDPAVSMNTLLMFYAVCNEKFRSVQQSALRLITPPVMAARPEPSGILVWTAAAFLLVFLFITMLIVLVKGLDPSLKYPGRFSRLTGLATLGAYPALPRDPQSEGKVTILAERCIIQMAQRLKLRKMELTDASDTPYLVFMTSTRPEEGKTLIGDKIIEKLRRTGMRVLALKPLAGRNKKPFTVSAGSSREIWDFEYAVPDNLLSVRNINELLQNFTLLTRGYHFVIIELPALLSHDYPALLVHSGNLTILVAKASGRWTRADQEIVGFYSRTAGHPVETVLNSCLMDTVRPVLNNRMKY